MGYWIGIKTEKFEVGLRWCYFWVDSYSLYVLVLLVGEELRELDASLDLGDESSGVLLLDFGVQIIQLEADFVHFCLEKSPKS